MTNVTSSQLGPMFHTFGWFNELRQISAQARLQEPKQDLGVSLVADLQPPVADQPRQRPLHHVPVAAQPLVRLDAAPGDPGRDAGPAQRQTAARVVVPLVAMQLCPQPNQATRAGQR